MPTYDYQCSKCGHTFELFQRITAKPVRKCPSCRHLGAKRLLGTGAGILFKGSGFYETDYRTDSYKKAAEKDSPSQPSKDGDKTKKETATATATASESPAKPDASKKSA